MHELSLMNAVVKEALKVSSEHGGRPVLRVTLHIGSLCTVEPGSLDWAFQALTRGTCAEGAELDLSMVAARVRCEGCGEAFQPRGAFWVCPNCGGRGGRVLEGDDLLLQSVELQEDGASED